MSKKKYLYYKGVRVNKFGIPVLISKKDTVIKTKHRGVYNNSFVSPFAEKSVKNLIVMYDIPHTKKKERDWFRRHLKKFGYNMIQRSVWVGPSPLPKEFLEYVEEIGLKSGLKTFKLADPYIGQNNF